MNEFLSMVYPLLFLYISKNKTSFKYLKNAKLWVSNWKDKSQEIRQEPINNWG